jgi:hypothetical protein
MTQPTLTARQEGALNLIKRLHGSHTIPDGDRFHVDSIADVGGGRVMVHGAVCKDPTNIRWFEHYYSFLIGPRGAITMVTGPKSMKEVYNGRAWCGIHIRIR